MPRLSKSERLSLWLERLTRFYNSGQSVAEFCLSENISQPSFYQWKRRLSPSVDQPSSAARKKPRRKKPSASATGFTELSVTSSPLAATRIRLPQDVVIELGTEQTTAKAVVDQILLRCLEANSNKAPSC